MGLPGQGKENRFSGWLGIGRDRNGKLGVGRRDRGEGMGRDSCLVTLRPTSCPALPGKPGTRDWTAQRHRVELNTTVRGEGRIDEMIPNNDSYRSIPCLVIIRIFLWQQIEMDAETQSQTYRESLNWRSPSHPSPGTSRNPSEEWEERCPQRGRRISGGHSPLKNQLSRGHTALRD